MEDIPTEHGRRLLVLRFGFLPGGGLAAGVLVLLVYPRSGFVFLPIICGLHAAVFVSFLIIWNKSPEAWRLVIGFC